MKDIKSARIDRTLRRRKGELIMGAKDIKPYGDLLHDAKLHGGVEQLINDIEATAIAIQAQKQMKKNGFDFHPDPILISKIKRIYDLWNL